MAETIEISAEEFYQAKAALLERQLTAVMNELAQLTVLMNRQAAEKESRSEQE